MSFVSLIWAGLFFALAVFSKLPGLDLLVSERYSREVLAYFKSTGEGWQSRKDGVLREYVVRQSRRAQR